MNIGEVIIIVAGALVGWGLVWGLITVIHQQKKPPYDPHAMTDSAIEAPSLAELAEPWHRILEVPQDATLEQIEGAYRDRLAECDRLGDSPDSRKRRSHVEAAFRFIRGSR